VQSLIDVGQLVKGQVSVGAFFIFIEVLLLLCAGSLLTFSIVGLGTLGLRRGRSCCHSTL
jgi:hypothetical protein